MKRAYAMTWGAQVREDGDVRFRLWAPAAKEVCVVLVDSRERSVAMRRDSFGWYEIIDERARAGARYVYEIDGEIRVPDPASRFQPEGPNGPSLVVDPSSFSWPPRSPPLRPFAEMVFYELHIGAFTPDGTYAAAAERFDHLVALGITAVELMPVAETPGSRNWGYDGVMQYAPAHCYGTPDDLKRFVVAAHAAGLAVFLDVVYNHFGPEGNYLHRYAPQYFTERYQTAWGAAIDYASPANEAVRRYTIENAGYWLYEYGFDGLRLDAVHAIFDERSAPILQELAIESRAAAVHPVYLVLENDANDPRLLRGESWGNGISEPSATRHAWEFDAQWNDDVHHALHVLLTGEQEGYYQDFVRGPVALLGRALTSGFAYQGEASAFRGGRGRGGSTEGIPLIKFVNFLQNHDQVGNRAGGERIFELAQPQAVRAALSVILLAPSPPLIFMGEEWGASTPFLFFCDFEPELAKLVTSGRQSEFAGLQRFADPQARAAIADPALHQTFERSKLDWSERELPQHQQWLNFYRSLLRCRHQEIAPRAAQTSSRDAGYRVVGERGLRARWRLADDTVLRLEANLGDRAEDGFCNHARGRVIFASEGAGFTDGRAAPWAVRWALG
jgi:malto-oligosyltrehalose trehalohydrolase